MTANSRLLITAKSNNSMDVGAKQRLSFSVAWLLSAGLVAVSPHVISIVMLFCSAETFYL